ncbi:MAG: glutamate--tRNA ligase [Bacteroides sp.]|nr:glutamate--tRNA ligase [Ruminococcus flavefaciens]MCM1554214.1 glutamate--tRNA ligase [Bacteroides sp.]
MSTERKVRVRFAPSPTGPLHIGGVRTALFNYLFAKQHGGDFLLRIEDTDSNRFVPGAEEYIIEAFKWLGIPFDEGVGIGGPHGPYRQSERRDIYRKYVQQLLDSGHAYYAFDTPGELEAMRKRLEESKSSSQQYDASTRMEMKNSLSLPAAEVKALLDAGTPYVVRVRIEPGQDVTVNDMIRGEVTVNSGILDDKVLYKSADDLPTYHLANIVDDHLMEITHVIRGEEWLPSAPLHVLLYQFFGWQDSMPRFAHLPLLLKPDGNGKLSKRDGDRLGFPVFPLAWTDPKTGEKSSGYRESGYYPEAVVNMLAFLGWNPGTEEELFTLSGLVQAFNLEKVSKSGAKFNLEKAHWFNHQYLQQHSNEDLAESLKKRLAEPGIRGGLTRDAASFSDTDLQKIVGLVKERLSFPKELWEQAYFFFEAPEAYDEKVVKKRWSEDMPQILRAWCAEAEKNDFSAAVLESLTQELIGKNGWNAGKVFNSMRLSLVGASMGPHIFDIMEIIGKQETLARIETACQKIGSGN